MQDRERGNKIAYIKQSSIVKLPNECSLITDLLKVNSAYGGHIMKEIAPSNITVTAGISYYWGN